MLLTTKINQFFDKEPTNIFKCGGDNTDENTVATEESDLITFTHCFGSACDGVFCDDVEETSNEILEDSKKEEIQPRSVTLVQTRADGIEIRTLTNEQSLQYSATLIQSCVRGFITRRKVDNIKEERQERRQVAEEAAEVARRRLTRLAKKERRKEEEQKLLAEEKAFKERNKKERQKKRSIANKEVSQLEELAADIDYIQKEFAGDLLPLKFECGGLECTDERDVPTKSKKKKKTKPPVPQVICRIDKIDKNDASSVVEKVQPKKKRNGRLRGLFPKKGSSQDKNTKAIGSTQKKQLAKDYVSRKDLDSDVYRSSRKSVTEINSKSKLHNTKVSNESNRPREHPDEVKSKSVKREYRPFEPPIGILVIPCQSEKKAPPSTKTKKRLENKDQRRTKSSSKEESFLQERSKLSKSEKITPSSIKIKGRSDGKVRKRSDS